MAGSRIGVWMGALALLAVLWGVPVACGGTTPEGGGAGGRAAGGGSSDASGGMRASGGQGQASGGKGGGAGGETAAGGTSAGGGAAGAPGGAGGSTGHTGPCYDEECIGICEGNCEEGFVCNTDPIPCAAVLTIWCGCDGETFQSTSGCPDQAFAHDGACQPKEGKNCDERDIVCLPLVPPAPCPEGQVHSVDNGCHGECVPISECACSSHDECPDPKQIDQYACHAFSGRCGDWL